jgi:acetylornithine deacetylase/succinyl-diaminopimelate desuccinylase-like protein
MSHDRLEKRRRAISRIALYGSLVIAGVIGVLLVGLASNPLLRPQNLAWGQEMEELVETEAVRLLGEYVRIDTSETTGDVAEGARFLARALESEGIEAHLEILGSGDANLWAVLEGKRTDAVVLHHHIDVSDVPDPSVWPFPPFEARIDGPWMYGRGTFDMKSVAVAQLLAFLDLARSGETPERSVIFLATSSEETGSQLGTRWVLEQHPELGRRFGVVLTEGGVVEGLGHSQEIKYWGTELGQKRYATIIVCDPSRERLEGLVEDLRAYGADGGPIELDGPERLVDEVRAFLPHYAPSRDREDFRHALADPEVVMRDRWAFERLAPYLKAMFRTEIHPRGIRRAGPGWELEVGVHMLPGTRFEDVRDEILGSWLFHGSTVQYYTEPSALHGSPPDHPAMRTIERTVRQHRPGIPVGPMFLPWTATDARFFRAHGIPSFGFSPFLVLTTDAIRVDQTGERISVPDYVDGVELYREIVARLTADTGRQGR